MLSLLKLLEVCKNVKHDLVWQINLLDFLSRLKTVREIIAINRFKRAKVSAAAIEFEEDSNF